MKRLVALMMCAVSLGAAAQFPSLPYNPDENGDMLIGVVDLQALLANYGQEFSSAVVSENGESAIVFMGDMAYAHCKYSCKQLPGYWSLPNLEDLVPVWSEVYNEESPNTWLYADQLNMLDGNGPGPQYLYPFFKGNEPNPSGRYVELAVNGFSTEMRCYCAAKQLPRVEYVTCKASCSEGYAALDACVNEKVAEGWYPLQSQRQQQVYNDCFWQPLWRWAE
ncbi:hypothetical protein N9D95_00650 [Flavobacteriales bacterium]|nr:hypothetical protein [Flavobacteriales bacterium]